MAVFCITTSNPEFQKLLAESGEKQGVFAMMVSKWMTENEVYDRYPTLQELGISPMTSVKPGVAEVFEYNDSLQSFKDKLINIIGIDKIKELYSGTDVKFDSFIIDDVELGTDKDLIITIKTDKGQRTAFNLRLDGDYQYLKISEGSKTVRGIYAPLSEKNTAIDFLISEFKKVSIDKLTGNLKFPSYNEQKEYYLAKDVKSLLQNIVKFTKDTDTKLLAETLLKVPNINNIPLTITKYTKELRGRIKDNPDALGTYSSALPELITVIGNLPKSTFETVFLHELIHGVTVNEYYKNKEFSDKINTLYNYALKFKDYNTSKRITLGKMYGMKNPKEFMSEAMTNPDFIYELSKYYSPFQEKLKKKNIFQEFIDLVVSLIKTKIESKGKKYIENNLGTNVLNVITNYANVTANNFKSLSKLENNQIKPGVSELFESNPELSNAVYEALGFKTNITQDNKSYYRGQLKPFKIDRNGNLILEPKYAGWQEEISYDQYKGMGISMSPNLSVANAQGNMFYEGNVNRPQDEGWMDERDAEDWTTKAQDEGYYILQVDKAYITENFKDIFDNENYEQRIGTTEPIIIPKGKFKIENITPDVDTQITPQQKQQAQQLYSQYLDTTTNPTIEGFKSFVGNVGDAATDTGLDMSSDEARAFNSLVNDGTIEIKCE